MLLKKESVEAHIYRTFIAATLWGKLVFYAFCNDSPGPLFKSHAHKFHVFTTGQKTCYSVLFFTYHCTNQAAQQAIIKELNRD